MYKHVSSAVGTWDAAGIVFAGKQPAVTFNVSETAAVSLPSECKGAGEGLQGTQYHDLFLYRGKDIQGLQPVALNVDLALELHIIEDRVSRLAEHVRAATEGVSDRAMCQSFRGALGPELQAVNTAGRYALLAGEAITELQCQQEIVTIDNTEEKCYTALPVIRNGGKKAFMDLRRRLLQDVATEVPCTADTVLYFWDHRGGWY